VPSTLPVTMDSFSHNGEPVSADVVIPSDAAEARAIQDRIEQLLRDSHASDRDVFGVKLALEEAVVNAIKHGNQMDRTRTVRIRYHLHGDRLEITVTDQGPGFDPTDVPDPTAAENLERPCGRGLMLMRHYMTEVEYTPPGNSVHLVKVFRNGKRRDHKNERTA
jgi:serine/threonine-protein kinase RsbW